MNDIEKKMVQNKNIINNMIEKEVAILSVSRLTLSKKLLGLLKSKKLILIADKEIKYNGIRFLKNGEKVYINVTESTKFKNNATGIEYTIPVDELYAYLLEGAVTLYFDELTASRDLMETCITVYLDLIRRVLLKKNHMSSQNARDKLDFILCYYILSNNNIKCITNNVGYARKKSDILERDYEMMVVKYPEFKGEKLSEEKLWKILQNEFIFLKDINLDSFKYDLIYHFGATNNNILSDLTVIGTIIADFAQGNKAKLNVLKNNFLKESIKGPMVNDIIWTLSEKM